MKNIIVLSDGTGSGAAKKIHTNVWRLYNALDLHDKSQIAYYDDGVGSQEFLPLKILGGAFGFGLKRNVLELYKFLCRNYKENKDDSSNSDKIYLFGFSRGAFTVRMLAGMVAKCGLYTDHEGDEERLDERARNNYDLFRTEFNHTGLSRLYTCVNGVKECKEGCVYPEIEFMGVWDTVDAYGFPIDEITQLWDKLIFPVYFPDYRLSPKVKRAKQALCIDDERYTFHPLLWDERGESKLVKSKRVEAKRIEQVWFAGMHSDVGGGYAMNSLSLVPLDWMIEQVEYKKEERPDGLKFISSIRKEIHNHSDYNSKQHNSRSGVGAYYRYKPRMLLELYEKVMPYGEHIPKIHFSVLERIKSNATVYAPIGIPSSYEVVNMKGETMPPYESPQEAECRVEIISDAVDVVSSRKYLYYAFIIATFILLASRLLPHKADVSTLPTLLKNLLPELLLPWFEALAQNPRWLLLFAATFIVMLLLKQKFWRKMQVITMNAWSVLKGRKV